jgi:hypothetical protein
MKEGDYALWSDQKGVTRVGPPDVAWDTYTACSMRGHAIRTNGLFRVVGVGRVPTCLPCIAAMELIS